MSGLVPKFESCKGEIPRLEPGQVHLWRASLAIDASLVDRLRRSLSPDELERAARFRFEKDRTRFVAARGLLRSLVGAYLGMDPGAVRFAYGPAGKPYLARDGCGELRLEFNLAHSYGLGLFGFALGMRIGVDVERIRPEVEWWKIASRHFAPGERDALWQLSEPERPAAFFRMWTRKEAFLKALGVGLRRGLACSEVLPDAGSEDALVAVRGERLEARNWRVVDVPVDPLYPGAAAVESREARFRCWEWSPELLG